MHSAFTVTFGEELIAAPVESVCGLGEAEGWGRWNNDSRVSIRFDRSLPSRFEAQFACAVTPVNIGRVFTVIAGGCCRKFVSTQTMRHGLEVAKVRFHGAEPARTLEILIPDTEPGSLFDPRRLGLALGSLTVIPLPSNDVGSAVTGRG